MAWYELGEDVWIVEQRGRAVWTWYGRSGNRGRVSLKEYKTDASAAKGLAAAAAAQVAAGYSLVDADRKIGGHELPTTKPCAPTTPSALITSQRIAVPGKLLIALPFDVATGITAFLDTFTDPKDRIGNVHFEIADDARWIDVHCALVDGEWGHGDYASTEYKMRFETASLDRADLADSLDFETYAEDMWRFKSKRVITHVKRLIAELAPWTTIAELDVTSFYER